MKAPGAVVDKLRWAQQHLEDLTAEVDRFMQGKPYSIVREGREEGRRYVFTLRVRGDPPTRISLILGDFLHNARSALDYLVYAIAATPYDGSFPLEEARKLQFPIVDTPDQFKKQTWRLALLSQEVQTEIERLQVFAAGEDEAFPLLALRDLSNFAKHRELSVVAASYGVGRWVIPRGGPLPITALVRDHSGIPIDGTELAEITFSAPVPSVEMNIEFVAEFLPIALTRDVSEYWSNEAVPWLCVRIMSYIMDILLPRFERFV